MHGFVRRINQLNELEVEFFNTGVLTREKTTNVPALSTFVPPNLDTRLASVPEVPQVPQSSSGAEEGRFRPTGRISSKEDHSSAMEISTCQLNSGHDLRRLEIENDEYDQRGTTSRQKFSDVVETHTFPLACLQARPGEVEPSNGEICSRCDEDAERVEALREPTILGSGNGLVDSNRNQLQLHNGLTVR